MPYYDENNIPDDPYRVAPPFCAPGEVEPPDAPQVSNKETTARVIDVLLSAGDPESKAFGKNSADWIEFFVDLILDPRNGCFAHTVFTIILDESKSNLLPILRSDMERFIGYHANNWLAEANPDELEREGF